MSDQLDFIKQHSCLMSYGWDWATGYKNPQELYRLNRVYTPENPMDPFNYGTTVIQSKNRIRGRGTALSIRLEAPEGKACKILGLGVIYSVPEGIK